MEYNDIRQAKFLSRPNRFIAHMEINGQSEVAHMKNTGRCKELLVPGTIVFVQESNNPCRKTKYDLITVYKGSRLINIDSRAPNKAFHEWIKKSGFFRDIIAVKPEVKYNRSRFDFYIETKDRKIYVEVKGATLEENGIVMFPDAPTERGVKHINELCECVSLGYEAYVVFIVQMKGVRYFTPNDKTHKEFGEALRAANKKGVHVLAIDCAVTENSIYTEDFVEVRL